MTRKSKEMEFKALIFGKEIYPTIEEDLCFNGYSVYLSNRGKN